MEPWQRPCVSVQLDVDVGGWLLHHACPHQGHVGFVQSRVASRAQVGMVVVVVVVVVVEVVGEHVTWAVSLAFPFKPVEHDGRLSVQFGIPSGGQEVGASTPLQAVHVPPLALQPPVRTQTANPVNPERVHASPMVPIRVMSPLGAFTVTLHAAPADGCVMLPSSHDESVNGPPPELLTEKVKVV